MIRLLSAGLLGLALVLSGGSGSAYGGWSDSHPGGSGGKFGVAGQETVWSDGFETGDCSAWGACGGTYSVEGPGHVGSWWLVLGDGWAFKDFVGSVCYLDVRFEAWLTIAAGGTGESRVLALSEDGDFFCKVELGDGVSMTLFAVVGSEWVGGTPVAVGDGTWGLRYVDVGVLGSCELWHEAAVVDSVDGVGAGMGCLDGVETGGVGAGMTGTVSVDEVVVVGTLVVAPVGGMTFEQGESLLDGLSVVAMLLGIAVSCSVAAVVALVFLFFRR